MLARRHLHQRILCPKKEKVVLWCVAWEIANKAFQLEIGMPMEEDIKALLEIKKLSGKNIREANERSLQTKRFSYIPYLVRASYEVPNLAQHTTLKILEFLNQLFTTPQCFQREIEVIGAHLRDKDDLFPAFLTLLENKVFRDDSYYWHPDLTHTNVFSFVCDLFNDVSSLLILHIIKNLIVDGAIQKNFVEMFESRLSVSALAQISIMKRDMEIFHDECAGGIAKNNLPLHDGVGFSRRIVSHSYWTDIPCEPFGFFEIEQPTHLHRKYFPCSCFSMVEVEFSGKKAVTLLVTLKALEDLLLKKEDMKWYWTKLGIVDDEWNFVV